MSRWITTPACTSAPAARQQDNNYNSPDLIIQDTLVLANGFALPAPRSGSPWRLLGPSRASSWPGSTLNKQDVDFSVTLYEIMADGRFFELTYYLGRASYAADPTRRQLLQPGIKTTIPFTNTKLVSRQLGVGSRLLVVVNVNKNRFAQVNYGSVKEVSDETMVYAGKPLEISWSNESFILVPVAR